MTSHLDEFNVSSTSQGVKGRLKASINFWIDRLEAPEFVISMIREGYRIPFGTYPTRCFLKNNNSALKHPEFVESAILELLANGCIEEHATPPLCVNPLTVAEGKKLRLVIDLRHVNDFLVKPKFKYEDLRSLSEVVEENHWFFTWDLKSGYHHVDIFKDHQKYLGFSWAFQGVFRYFTFCVLPFGLSSACYCFTKLMRPLVKRWRSMGHLSFVYLDDGFSSHADKLSAIAASTIQSQDLKSSGLMCNEEKSHWAPTQIGEWLGFIINTISMEFHVPDKKLTKLKDMLGAVIQDGSTTYRQLAKIAGSIISLTLGVGSISRLLTRQMYYTVASRSAGWDQSIVLSPAVLEEVRFWLTNLDALNGHAIRPRSSPCTLIYSDASDVAFGGYSSSLDGSVVRGMWTTEDIGQSSTYRELRAIYYVLLSFADQLRHQKVTVYTDSQSAARILYIGSTKCNLQRLAMDIFQLCWVHEIFLSSQWIPRSLNRRADELSRFIDPDDWSIHPSVFQVVNARWGPHTIDRFASHYNAQLIAFNSKYACPGSCGIDALSQDWSSGNSWLCPPVHLIVGCVRHLAEHRGRGTLVVPEWHSAYFWPFLCTSANSFKPFVKSVFVLPKIHDLLLEGPGQLATYKRKASVFSGCPPFNMLALKLDFIADHLV